MSTRPLPPYVAVGLIAERLPVIFPEGTANRTYCTREMAARTVFVMLYLGAVEGADRWLAPKHVYRMTEDQARDSSPEARLGYGAKALRPGFMPTGRRWYADNTREPIRDETLREGLLAVGAALARTDLPTTSSRPRYALEAEFAALFAPSLSGPSLDEAIADWQRKNLSKGALTRIALRRRGADSSAVGVMVTFPNGETRRLAPGPSSEIARSVIESFAPRFLQQPVVLWLSESGNKVVSRARVAFLTAYADRDAAAFKKTISMLAWGTFAWLASEPDNLLFLREGQIVLDHLVTIDP